jgi:hypothetical protein
VKARARVGLGSARVEAVGIGEAPLVAIGRTEEAQHSAPAGRRPPDTRTALAVWRGTMWVGAVKRNGLGDDAWQERAVEPH